MDDEELLERVDPSLLAVRRLTTKATWKDLAEQFGVSQQELRRVRDSLEYAEAHAEISIEMGANRE